MAGLPGCSSPPSFHPDFLVSHVLWLLLLARRRRRQRRHDLRATDEFGFRAADKPVQVHELHATMLYLLGFDHTRLTYRYTGRDFRLTDVHGRVVKDLLA
jgi:hypothetical protein